MNKTFFKIIIPSFNNHLLLKVCIDSILNQKFHDYKIVIIDDNSTDEAYRISQAYSRKNKDKIILLRPETKKYAGGCRNLGLNTDIDSEYIMFIDNDDKLTTENSLKRLHQNIIDNNYPDCIFLNHLTTSSKPPIFFKSEDKTKAFESGAAPWKYVIKSKFSNIRFPEDLKNNEDVIWSLNLYNTIDTFVATDDFIYTYNDTNTNSISRIYDSNTDKKICRLLKEIHPKDEFIKNRILKYLDQFNDETKKIDVNDFYKNSYAISIDNDRYSRFCDIFSTFTNIIPKMSIGYQIKTLTGANNCTLSHLQIVKFAKLLDLPFVVIFEDDAYPRQDILQSLKIYLSEIPKSANIVFLGWCEGNNSNNRRKGHFMHVDATISGSQSYIVFNNVYDRYIKLCNTDISNTADGVLSKIDNCYMTDKPLFIQYSPDGSMHEFKNYIYYGSHDQPPDGFPTYEKLMNID